MPTKMKELPISERPYEKLEMYGEHALSTSELLAIIIKTGTKEESALTLAQRVLKDNGCESLRNLQDIPLLELERIKGIGRVKAIQLKAVCEIAKRISMPINTNKICIKTGYDVAKLLMDEMRYLKREIAKLILLNNKNIIIKIVDIAFGGGNFACLEPKEIMQEAIKAGASRIILVHNHPSGDATPSKQDYLTNDRIYEAAEIIGIELLDHIVIGDGEYKSLLYKESKKEGMRKL